MADAAYQRLLPALTEIIKDDKKDDLKWAGYIRSCEHAEEMSVHLCGDKPQKLLNRVRPREDGAITKYRLESYEPTTKSTAEKGVTLVNKIFNPKLYAIKPKEGEKGKQLYDYAMVEYPKFNSVVNYFSQFGLKKTLVDANGIFLIEPSEIPYREEGGEIVADVTKQIRPVITCYPSCDIFLCDEDYYLVFLGNGEDKDLKVKWWKFKYIDRQEITVIKISTANNQNYKYEIVSSYTHDFGEIPAWKCGGTYDQKIHGLFESFFYPAVPFWNKAVNSESDLDGAFISHLHPVWWSVAEECEFVETKTGARCQNGTLWLSNVEVRQCPECSGSGKKPKGPYETLTVTRDKLIDPNGNQLSQPPGGYVDVPTAATQMLVDRVQRLLEQGLSALNMDIVNKIGNNQSGEAKAYDRTELFDFLGKVRDLFYDTHLVNTFYFFGKYMFYNVDDKTLKDSIEPTIIKPNQFDIYTTDELVEQLKVSKDAGVSPVYLQTKSVEVINKEFQSHPEALEYMNLVVEMDPLAEISRTDVSAMVLDGSVSQITIIVHDNIRKFVRRALEEDKNFGAKPFLERMEIITGFAEEESEAIEEESKVRLEAAQAAMIQPDAPPDPNAPVDVTE